MSISIKHHWCFCYKASVVSMCGWVVEDCPRDWQPAGSLVICDGEVPGEQGGGGPEVLCCRISKAPVVKAQPPWQGQHASLLGRSLESDNNRALTFLHVSLWTSLKTRGFSSATARMLVHVYVLLSLDSTGNLFLSKIFVAHLAGSHRCYICWTLAGHSWCSIEPTE